MSTLDRTIAKTIIDPGSSLKRLAWAYGCSKKGSDEERQLRGLLLAKLATESATDPT